MAVAKVEDSSHGARYVPELDGFRGIAIILVVGFHAGLPGFRVGGYLGVDLFFVLSGYLITSILLQEKENKGRIDILNFYFRRWARLAPAFFVLILFTIIANVFIINNTGQIFSDIISAFGYIANWTRAFGSGSPMYLGHVWSLAIEEQFYLVWPILLSALLSAISYRRIFSFVIILSLLSGTWRAWLSYHGAPIDRIYNGTDTRIDCLFIGCALALSKDYALISFLRKQIIAAICAISTFLIIFLNFRYDSQFMYIVGFAIVSLSAAVIINYLVSETGSRLCCVFRLNVLVYIGKLSYSLYLWHYPILLIIWLKWGQDDPRIVWMAIPFVFVVSMVSYHFVEKPCLRWRSQVNGSEARIWGAISVCVSLSAMFGAIAFFLC